MKNNIAETSDHLSGPREFWQEKIPEHADVIMEVLAPFYDPELSFDLKSPLKDLKSLYKKAIFWQDVIDIKVVYKKDDIYYKLKLSFVESLWNNLRININPELNIRIVSCVYNLSGNFGLPIWGGIWTGLWDTLIFACILAIEDNEDSNFQTLLELWRSGNFPVGFDEEGNLLVLCADSTD